MISTAERPSRASTAAQQFAHRGGDGHVQAGERLVEEQHIGLGGQRARQRDALGLPAGELARHPVGEVGGVDLAAANVRRRARDCAARKRRWR